MVKFTNTFAVKEYAYNYKLLLSSHLQGLIRVELGGYSTHSVVALGKSVLYCDCNVDSWGSLVVVCTLDH